MFLFAFIWFTHGICLAILVTVEGKDEQQHHIVPKSAKKKNNKLEIMCAIFHFLQ